MRNGIKVRHTDIQINVRIKQAVISYSKLTCDCNNHVRCTHVREKNWVQQENKDSKFLSFPYVLAPVFSTPAFSTTIIYSCFFHSCIFHPCGLLLLLPLLQFPPLLSSSVVSTPAFSTPAFSAPPPPRQTSPSPSLLSVAGPAHGRRGGRRGTRPRSHQQQCRSNIIECYKSNVSFDNVECCFDIVAVFGNIVAGFGNNVERIFVLSTKSQQIEHVQFVSTLSKGLNFVRHYRQKRQKRQHCCRNRQHCCQKGNNVEATFAIVERTKLYDKRSTLLPFVATKSMLLRHCCWCRRGTSRRGVTVTASSRPAPMHGRSRCRGHIPQSTYVRLRHFQRITYAMGRSLYSEDDGCVSDVSRNAVDLKCDNPTTIVAFWCELWIAWGTTGHQGIKRTTDEYTYTSSNH